MKSMKKLIRTSWTGCSLDEDVLAPALLQYRNTPSRKDGASPAVKLFGRAVQDILPAYRRALSSDLTKTANEIDQGAAKTTEEHSGVL